MENLRFLVLSFLFITFCAFTCEEDSCNTLEDLRSSFDIELSSTDAVFEVGDELNISGIFSADIISETNDLEYNLAGQTVHYDFDLFEVKENNQAVVVADNKIHLSSISINSDGIFKKFEIDCQENCNLDLTMELKEAGYFGIVFKTGDFVTMEDCVVITTTGEKSDVNNFDVLSEIETNEINYAGSTEPLLISPDRSFFFKVE